MIQHIFRKVINKSETTFKKFRWKLELRFTKKLFLSFGENCLTDNILERHKLKLFSTPFSHGRSNVEYIIQLELDNYKDFLNPEFIQYETLNKVKVPRLKVYNNVLNAYNELHENGFEFTHHDVIASEALRSKFHKRVKELQAFKKSKKIVILYHHRTNPKTDKNRLFDDLLKLGELYSYGNNKSEVVCFTQKIINDPSDRKLDYDIKKGVHYFEFYTLNEWAGEDNDIFWARCDEDLITLMISKIKKL